MPGENIQDWSTTAASNSNSDSSINWAEGQPRASVNNSARAMMAAHAKQRNLLNGSIVTAGSANAQTFFSGLTYTAPIPTGLRVLLKIGPSLTNTAAATLEMDGLGAVAIKDQLGADLGAGALTADTRAEFIYSGTNWILLTTLTAPTPAANDDSNKIATTGWVHDEIQSIPGRTDGVAVATGDVGEYLEAGPFTLPAGSLPVGLWVNPGSLSLPAGDWDVWAQISIQGASNGVAFYAGLNDGVAATPPDPSWVTTGYIGTAGDAGVPIGAKHINFTGANKTILLVTNVAGVANYGISAAYVRARRRS